MSDTSSADRCRGVLIGLAAGDRNGGPIRMAVRLAESLFDCGAFNSTDILERYLRLWREGAFDTGPVSERALKFVAAGMPAAEATAQVHREFSGKTAERSSQRWQELLRISSQSMGLYRLRAGQPDEQNPHSEDEVCLVVSGKAIIVAKGELLVEEDVP